MNFADGSARKGSVINITSLIDVMFLLVIFVLLSAKFEPDGAIAVNLPEGQTKDEQPRQPTVLTITSDGTLYFQKDRIEFPQLAGRIQQMQKNEKDPVLVINPDRDSPSGVLVRAIDVARQNGQSLFSIKQKPE